MLGAAVYILRAQNTATIPLYNGRLAHAAFLSAIREVNPRFANILHDTQPHNPFTVTGLAISSKMPQICKKRNEIIVRQNERIFWRITGLNETFVPYLTFLVPGYTIRINSLALVVEKCCLSADEHNNSGLISKAELLAACLNVPQIEKISFSFLSPTTFRFFDRDYPWPMPSYVFGSLAEKWTLNDTQNILPLNKAAVRDVATAIFPEKWQGKSCVVPVKKSAASMLSPEILPITSLKFLPSNNAFCSYWHSSPYLRELDD